MYTSTFLYFFNEGVLFDVFDVFPKKQLQFERVEYQIYYTLGGEYSTRPSASWNIPTLGVINLGIQ